MCFRFFSSLLLLGVSIASTHAQVLTDSIRVEGNYRVFHYNKPTKPLANPALVFVMHGSGGDGLGMMRAATKMDQQAGDENTLVVYPDGYKRYWNECRKASPAQANKEDVNEQAFFTGMVTYFQQRYQIDPKAVFAVGTSGGGHMAYKLALTMPGTFRAVTAIIANLPGDDNLDCVPSGKPVAIMIINGTDDPVNPYKGGPVILGQNMNMGVVRSTEQTLAYWANLARYQGQPTHDNVPDRDPADGKTIERFTYRAKGKPDVVLLKVNGGKHDYPNDIDVHLEALTFFQQQRKRQ
ncbi:Poly(3-hydroxybutyrate) depolymerase-like protein [Fibrella aestuarina BUZ 2]|uniref:Poly(3-hydroxybutyrate) depolymerase-like protein n=1 Tax=Fibrella aestuarina BUZ 2 TaxID=1166018 RepID=I0K692_9BACT|nr:alpha/beta hydrolase-fold protein [Fibrella aestuarina]CCG99645.1 Poly(3-hydroxybutyrate) depolymerase-like protein [Fibrella aestuarina BUZ 2]